MTFPEKKIDLLITGGTLLTMVPSAPIVEEPLIGVVDGRIHFIAAAGREPRQFPEAVEYIDASGCLIMPGLVNCHTHLPMVLFRGLADDLPLMRWLNDYIFPVEGKYINGDTAYTGAMLAIAEMILSGTTTFCDGYFFESSIARAALDAGMRGIVAQGFIDFPTPDQPNPSRHAVVAEEFVQEWRHRSPLITPALICHSPYTCSPDTLKTIKGIARRWGIPFLIHLAETREEVTLLQKRFSKKPVHHLRDLDLLDGSTVAAHCIWLDSDEIDILAQFDVKVAHDPESNMKLGAGVAPVPAMLGRGISIGLGTDGCASNNNLDLFGEMGMCAKLHKVNSSDPSVLKAKTVVTMATMGGARVLGMAEELGSLAPGKWADMILVNMERPHLTPVYNPFSHLVYAASGADVTTSIIGGKVVMKNRRLLTINLPRVMDEVRKIGAQVVAGGYYRRAAGQTVVSRR